MAKAVLRWTGFALAALVVIGAAAFSSIHIASERIVDRRYPLPPSHLRATTDAQSIARGGRLVWVYGCSDCHGWDLQGRFIEDFGMSSRNLTVLARSFSDADFDRVIHRGLRPDGTSVAETMPSDAFQYMAEKDAADIVSYIRSLPAAGNAPPQPSYGWQERYNLLFGSGKTDVMWFASQTPALDLGPSFARGRQLAMTACGECHTTRLEGNLGDTPNLTLVASYERADFFTLMRTGKAAGNRELRTMSHTARTRFRHFTDDEIGTIYNYLVARGQKLTRFGR